MNVGPVAACRREGARALSALQFLTRLPLPDPGWEEGRLRYALAWFPLAGLVVGGLAGAVLWLAAGPLGLPAAFAAVLGISVAAWLSGALHEDGLADLADGTGTPGRSAEQALEIMRDSRIGAHGAVALILAFAARITLLAALSPLAAAGAL
ncbi:MAG: adenosylcobinamide-GDP ribazoletransferase, partial [Pseudomonadota bacterium]